MTIIIDGREIAKELQAKVAARVASLGCPPKLVVIIVGDDPASAVYVSRKRQAAERVGIQANSIRLPADVPQGELVVIIQRLNDDASVHGILVQLPLPPSIQTDVVLEMIHPMKDVDGFHPLNAGRLVSGTPYHVPCTPRGIIKLLQASETPVSGCRVLVIGCSRIVGQPVGILLTRLGATVTLAHKQTRDLVSECQRAEIIIAAAGCPNLVRRAHVQRDAVIIDVGINRQDGRIVGDVAYDECLGHVRAITPVPGGVGPMTVACLLENTIRAAQLYERNPVEEGWP